MTDDDGALTGRPLRLRVYLDERRWLGPGKADLLALIDETGSISAAGRRMKMSYKRAWTLAEALNAMFPEPLIESARGGAQGGGGGRRAARRSSPRPGVPMHPWPGRRSTATEGHEHAAAASPR